LRTLQQFIADRTTGASTKKARKISVIAVINSMAKETMLPAHTRTHTFSGQY